MPADFTQDYLLDNEREQFQQEVWIKTPGGGEIPALTYILMGRGNEIDSDLAIDGVLGGQTAITTVPTAVPDAVTTYANGLSEGRIFTGGALGPRVWVSTRVEDADAAIHFGMDISIPENVVIVIRESIEIRNLAQTDPEASDFLVPVFIVPQTIV